MSTTLNYNDLSTLKARYATFKSQKLALDMTRGKPCSEQLNLSDSLLSNINHKDVLSKFDHRNYSSVDLLTGLPEIKNIFADALGIKSEKIIIGGNSSLNLMYDTITKALLHKFQEQSKNWMQQGKIKFLCPTPGYDRHFAICESLGIEMINIPLTGNGPDMDQVESIVASDSNIKGMWCVPKYSNPTGESYSDEVIQRLATMKTAANDFRIFWDNAYAVHHLDIHNKDEILDILDECEKAGNSSRVFVFASTSKITYAGAGVSMIAANKGNYDWLLSHLKLQTIGYDKINQLRHIKLLRNKETLLQHMSRHADILRPKFAVVDQVLTAELGNDHQYASWKKPKGGYFINFDSQPNLARKIIQLSKDAGVKLTNAGATYPYGKDPKNCNIRIAPSLPSIDQLKIASEVLAVVTKIVTLEEKFSGKKFK